MHELPLEKGHDELLAKALAGRIWQLTIPHTTSDEQSYKPLVNVYVYKRARQMRTLTQAITPQEGSWDSESYTEIKQAQLNRTYKIVTNI